MHNQYLQILGLQTGATESDIKRAYRQLAKKYHPDINKDEFAKQEFIRITEAYKFLTDVGPRPNSEYVGYDYDPHQREYDAWRQRAKDYARRRAREEAAYQQSLLRKIYYYFKYVTAVLLTFNVLIIVDYVLPPIAETETIISISELHVQQLRRGGSSTYKYDQVVFRNYKFRVKKDQGREIVGDQGTIYTSPLLGIIKYAEVEFNWGFGVIVPAYGIYNLYKLMVPAALLFGILFYFMDERNSNKITIVVVISAVLLIQLFLLISFDY